MCDAALAADSRRRRYHQGLDTFTHAIIRIEMLPLTARGLLVVCSFCTTTAAGGVRVAGCHAILRRFAQ